MDCRQSTSGWLHEGMKKKKEKKVSWGDWLTFSIPVKPQLDWLKWGGACSRVFLLLWLCYMRFVNKGVLFFYCFHHLEFFALLTDPPSKTIDETSVDLFRELLNLNLVNYFLFCKVSTVLLFYAFKLHANAGV